MTDFIKRNDPTLLLLGLLGAACGPVAPQQPGDDSTGGTGPGTNTDPTEPTTTPVDPTSTEPRECDNDSDCYDRYCGYCTLEGRCEESVGCCGGYGLAETPRGNKFRCSPYYQCYSDSECEYGSACLEGSCSSIPIVTLPTCAVTSEVFEHWNLSNAQSAFVLADLDGDLDLDIASAQPGVAQIELFRNDGPGEFVLAGAFPVGEPLSHLSLAAGDLDGDGDVDLAVARKDDGGLVLLFGQDAMFVPSPPLPGVGTSPLAVHIADATSDGLVDIITIYDTPTAAGVRAGDGKGGFGGEQIKSAERLRPNTSVLDLNGDSVADLVSPGDGNNLEVWNSNGADFFLSFTRQIAAEEPTMIAADVDPGDGIPAPDLVLTGGGATGTVAVWRATSTFGEWTDSPVRFSTALPLRGGVLAELALPAGADLVAPTDGNSLTVLLSDGPLSFGCERTLTLDEPAAHGLLAAGDVDGDGVTEVVAGSPNSSGLTILHF